MTNRSNANNPVTIIIDNGEQVVETTYRNSFGGFVALLERVASQLGHEGQRPRADKSGTFKVGGHSFVIYAND